MGGDALRALEAHYREQSGDDGRVAFLLHPDDFRRVSVEVAEHNLTVILDEAAPPGHVACIAFYRE